jgi:hypothetical protein
MGPYGRSQWRGPRRLIGALLAGAALGACGTDVASPDLFVLSRSGAAGRMTLLVNDGGTVRCDGGAPRALPDQLLIDARQLAEDLASDAGRHLNVPPAPGSQATYVIRLESGTIRFADTAAARRPELARAELLAQQIAAGPCATRGSS